MYPHILTSVIYVYLSQFIREYTPYFTSYILLSIPTLTFERFGPHSFINPFSICRVCIFLQCDVIASIAITPMQCDAIALIAITLIRCDVITLIAINRNRNFQLHVPMFLCSDAITLIRCDVITPIAIKCRCNETLLCQNSSTYES